MLYRSVKSLIGDNQRKKQTGYALDAQSVCLYERAKGEGDGYQFDFLFSQR